MFGWFPWAYVPQIKRFLQLGPVDFIGFTLNIVAFISSRERLLQIINLCFWKPCHGNNTAFDFIRWAGLLNEITKKLWKIHHKFFFDIFRVWFQSHLCFLVARISFFHCLDCMRLLKKIVGWSPNSSHLVLAHCLCYSSMNTLPTIRASLGKL